MLRFDPVTGEIINDNDIYTVRKCGATWYLMKQEYIGYSRKYHKSVYGNHIMGIFDHYETALHAQSYLMRGNITSSTDDAWSTSYITHFENHITYNTYITNTTIPVVTATVPRVLTQVPEEEATIG